MSLLAALLALTLVVPPQDFKGQVEQALGGVSLRAIAGTGQSILSLWAPYSDGKIQLLVLEPFAGTLRKKRVIDLEDDVYLRENTLVDFLTTDTNGDGTLEVHVIVDDSGNYAGLQEHLTLDLGTLKKYTSRIEYLVEQGPGTVTLDPRMEQERPDLIPEIERQMTGSVHLQDHRNPVAVSADEWWKLNGRIFEDKQGVVRPLDLSHIPEMCEPPQEERGDVVRTGNQVYVHHTRYGITVKNTLEGSCKLILTEGHLSYNTGIRLSGNVLLVEYMGTLTARYHINTGLVEIVR